jgi:class 3 adenylate cyclase/DNA-binding NarL/FixJ family response regulator
MVLIITVLLISFDDASIVRLRRKVGRGRSPANRWGCRHHHHLLAFILSRPPGFLFGGGMGGTEAISAVLADDNVIVREGVRALLTAETDIDVVAVAADYDGLVDAAAHYQPHVVVTDIRMPPTFTDEGIEAAKRIRKLQPGTGIVVLSQYDDPAYAISLLAEGSAGYAYLLKERVADGNRLARAIRDVATGGSMLDPEIVDALMAPARGDADLSPTEERLLRHIAEGRPVKAIAVAERTTPEAVDDSIEKLFLKLARDATSGRVGAVDRLRSLQRAIVEREEQGETLSRLLPGGLADKLRSDPSVRHRTERLDVTVLMSDVRGYSSIAERTDPTVLAGQLNEHRRAMNTAILEEGGTVMQYVGDAVMAVFGAPFPHDDHAACAMRAAIAMHERQRELDEQWTAAGRSPFGLGIGLSTGDVAAALLGSDERLEYTVVGDTVNLAQRLQDLARPAGNTVISGPTFDALGPARDDLGFEELGDQLVKGRETPVVAYRLTTAPTTASLKGAGA